MSRHRQRGDERMPGTYRIELFTNTRVVVCAVNDRAWRVELQYFSGSTAKWRTQDVVATALDRTDAMQQALAFSARLLSKLTPAAVAGTASPDEEARPVHA